ncbi:MAG: TlpA disulfide reductase family protein [Candidatus Ratteibacteria bacterium]|nr:TlpA disulfide reductase family protein [Candidatus Ratteibacteria bacterium]
MKKNFLIYILSFAFLALTGCEGVKETSTPVSSEVNIYGKAPLFVLPDFEGDIVSLEDMIGKKIILLNFHTLNCPYCLTMLPGLNELYENYKGEMEIVSVYIDESGPRLKSFVKKRDIRYYVLLDSKQQVAYQYGILGVPSLFVLDLEGEIRYLGHDSKKAEEVMKKLIDAAS